MPFERLIKIAAAFKPAELSIVAVLTFAILLASGPQSFDWAIPPTVGFTQADDALFAAGRGAAAGEWRDIGLYDAPVPDGVAWLDWNAPPEDLQRDGPTAISMSGPFSAEVYFNGEKIGQKGVPGPTAKTERAGAIDATFAIPKELIRASDNRVALRFSSMRAGYKPATVVQSLYFTSYSADARRNLRYYTPALLFSGALVAVALGLLMLARTRSDMRVYWLALGLAGLFGAIVAEVSRSLINYPYDWHQARQALVGVGFITFGMSLLRYVTLRWPASGRWGPAVLVAGAIAVALSWVMATGYDAKTVLASLALLFLAFGWTAWRGATADRTALYLVIPLAVLGLYALIVPGDFIDRSIYVLSVVLFGFALLRAPDLLSPRPEELAKKTILNVETSGRTVFVPVSDVTMLKAAGNYTEVHRVDGKWELDKRGLSAIVRSLPERFFRIHRSYVVYLPAAESLTTQEGSRYWLSLKSGERLPVSRARVNELRAAMKDMATQPH